MSDDNKRYVYREVSGRELEKATTDGWEYVDNRTAIGPFGPLGAYLVRRPFETPTEISLHAEIDELKKQLESKAGREAHLEDAFANMVDGLKARLNIDDGQKRTKADLASIIRYALRFVNDVERVARR